MFINDNYNLIIIIPTLPLRIDSAVHLHFHLSCMSTLKGFALFGYLSRFPFISSSRLWLFFCYQKQITKFKNSHFILDGLNRGDWKSKDLVFGCYIWPNLPGGPEWDQFEMCLLWGFNNILILEFIFTSLPKLNSLTVLNIIFVYLY